MTLIVETGAGVRGATAYHDTAFVATYLAARGRSEENGWDGLGGAEKDAFITEGTDYIEQRWGPLFRGVKEFGLIEVKSTGAILFAGLPVAAETLTLGDQVYTFVAALSADPTVADEVLIGADAAGTASNLFDALTALAANSGVTFGEGTQINRHATAVLDTATLTLTAIADGESGDFTVLTSAATNVTLTAFSGGLDGGAQPLSFPRAGLHDRAGVLILGIPLKLKQASAEYSVRLASGDALFRDPTVDALGGTVTRLRERVGPIDTETEYLPGTTGSGAAIAYPAADRLLQGFVRSGGVVVRG